MSFPKVLLIISCILFGAIGIVAIVKKSQSPSPTSDIVAKKSVEVPIVAQNKAIAQATTKQSSAKQITPSAPYPIKNTGKEPPGGVDRINEFFNKGDPKLPIVQTIVYKSRVPWQKGRPAWLSDYANYYHTSRHFIARSLNGKPDYTKQDVADGDRFNVFNPDANFTFYLLVDTSRSKMWFFYTNTDTNQHVLLKTYPVGLGRVDNTSPSGLLTPYGKYSLGSKTAIYKPKVMGLYNGQRLEMLTVFGTRWIPFDKEISGCTASPLGFGIHGVPWSPNASGELVEKSDVIGKYESDGCIRLATPDMEELFAIIISRPTDIEIVKDYFDAQIARE